MQTDFSVSINKAYSNLSQTFSKLHLGSGLLIFKKYLNLTESDVWTFQQDYLCLFMNKAYSLAENFSNTFVKVHFCSWIRLIYIWPGKLYLPLFFGGYIFSQEMRIWLPDPEAVYLNWKWSAGSGKGFGRHLTFWPNRRILYTLYICYTLAELTFLIFIVDLTLNKQKISALK